MLDTTTWLCGPPPATGQYQRYPSRFIINLKKTYRDLIKDKKVLEMFSGTGAMKSLDCAKFVTSDSRKETGADIIGLYNYLPLKSNTFDIVIADPPYTMGFARQWTNLEKDIPKPKYVLGEASRLTKQSGLIFILHVIIIPAYKEFEVKRIALHPILTGANNAIRVLNVFQKKK